MIEQAKALLDELHRERLDYSEYCLLWDTLTLLDEENARPRQAMYEGRVVELPVWPIPVNMQMGRYRIVAADVTAKTITIKDCGPSEAALEKEGME